MRVSLNTEELEELVRKHVLSKLAGTWNCASVYFDAPDATEPIESLTAEIEVLPTDTPKA